MLRSVSDVTAYLGSGATSDVKQANASFTFNTKLESSVAS